MRLTHVSKMGLEISSTYCTIFSSGVLVGVVSSYFILKQRYSFKENLWESKQEERYEFEDPKDEYRLIMAVRNDLKMQKGKVAAQCGHAAVAAYAKAIKRPKLLKNWLKHGGTKIAVKIDSEQELLDLEQKAKEFGIISSIVRDAGQTQVAPGTRTVIALGPAPKSTLDKVSGHLKLY